MVHLLGIVSDTQAALLSTVVGLCAVILGGVFHIVLRLGKVLQQQEEQDRRLATVEDRQHDHDVWHLRRGDR